MIRIMIVEDQPSVRKGLHMRLNVEEDFSVIGEATDGEAAVALARSLHPDVVLMDVEMPLMDGLSAAKAIHEIYPHVAIVFLSIHDDALTRARAEAAGAAAFVPKSLPTDTLLATIRQVARRDHFANAV